MAPTTPKHLQRPGPIFIPWCAGTSRRHQPPSPEQRTIRGSKEKCSAGACPQLGSRRGRGPGRHLNPPIRHSGEGRNPEGVGRGKTTRRWKKRTRHPIFILSCGLRKAMVIPAIKSMPRTPIRGGNPGEGRPAHPFHMESLWAVPPQPTVLVRSQFANAQDKLRSSLNSYRTAGFRSSIAARSYYRNSTVCKLNSERAPERTLKDGIRIG